MMMRLGRPKFVEPVLDYECNRCGERLACASPEEVLQVNTHRLLHLAVQWDKSLRESTGWVTDEDGGMRPVTE
jgi:hypothetical protein